MQLAFQFVGRCARRGGRSICGGGGNVEVPLKGVVIMKSQSGFTLIEMVAVIIILAIMAATALPKFTSLSGEARYASLSGLQGGLRSAMALAKAKWLVAQSGDMNSVNFNGTMVSVVHYATAPSGVGGDGRYLGYPYANSAGIEAAMDDLGTYTSGVHAGGIAWWPNGVATSSNCYVLYSPVSGASIKPTTGADAAKECS
jgi:MSHA pilin protein MshA